MFEFKVKKEDKKTRGRLGVFKTPHGEIQTPVFMPVGTKATVKTLSPRDLNELDAEIILANAYHLQMRPGADLVEKMGGLHKWMNWDKPILTDSGGFQVFSLGKLRKITESGVKFQSHNDGSTHYFTPIQAIRIQEKLGADIIMALDECAPHNVSKKYAREALDRTHRWAVQCKKAHNRKDQALFPIVQGVLYPDLRIESAKFLSELDLPGVAVGGLSVGEERNEMYEILAITEEHLPKNKPRYLMGVGSPEDLLEAVSLGYDMFDCVLGTRIARHGAFFTPEGRKTITNNQYRLDKTPLVKKCNCYCCQNFTRSYLRHLITEKEILGMHLLTMHNVHFLLDLMRQIRTAISKGTLVNFKRTFLKKYRA